LQLSTLLLCMTTLVKLLGHEVHLVGRLRAAEHPERLRSQPAGRFEAGGGASECLIPRRRTEPPTLSDHRFGQTDKAFIHRAALYAL